MANFNLLPVDYEGNLGYEIVLVKVTRPIDYKNNGKIKYDIEVYDKNGGLIYFYNSGYEGKYSEPIQRVLTSKISPGIGFNIAKLFNPRNPKYLNKSYYMGFDRDAWTKIYQIKVDITWYQ